MSLCIARSAAFLPPAAAAAAQRHARRQRLSVAVAASGGFGSSKKPAGGSGNKKVGVPALGWRCRKWSATMQADAAMPMPPPLEGQSHAPHSPAASVLVPSVLQQPKLARYLETDSPATAAGSAADDGWVRAVPMGRLQPRRACRVV